MNQYLKMIRKIEKPFNKENYPNVKFDGSCRTLNPDGIGLLNALLEYEGLKDFHYIKNFNSKGADRFSFGTEQMSGGVDIFYQPEFDEFKQMTFFDVCILVVEKGEDIFYDKSLDNLNECIDYLKNLRVIQKPRVK